MRKGVRLQAHKGVEAEYPENTMPSFLAAVSQGYEMIELDLGVTKDDKIVVLHNSTINDAARLGDGSELPREVKIGDITYEEALKYDFGIKFSEEFAGTRIPLFSEVLDLAEKSGVMLKIDSKISRFSKPHLSMLFDMLRKTKAPFMISCWSREAAELVHRELPQAGISFDGISDEKELKYFSELAGRDNFYVWAPIDYSMAGWVPKDWWLCKENCELIKKYGRFCIWGIESVESFEKAAEAYHPYAAETTGIIKPE